MGTSSSQPTSEEIRLSTEEIKAHLHLIPAQVSYDAFIPCVQTDLISEHDFYGLLQAYNLQIDNSVEVPGLKEMHLALRKTEHRFKARLTLVFFQVHSNAPAQVKAEHLFSVYSQEQEASLDVVRQLVYNVMDVGLNVSKKLLLSDTQVQDYISQLRKARSLLFSSIASHFSSRVTKSEFISVMSAPEHQDLLTTTGLRKAMWSLLQQNVKKEAWGVKLPLGV